MLAARLAAAGTRMAVVNGGIGGGRVLEDGVGPNALARFDRDVLAQPGVTHVTVLEGINDIGVGGAKASPSVAELIAGHRQMIDRAHARGLRIYGATLTPFEGAAAWTPEGEAKRQALNDWIRNSGPMTRAGLRCRGAGPGKADPVTAGIRLRRSPASKPGRLYRNGEQHRRKAIPDGRALRRAFTGQRYVAQLSMPAPPSIRVTL